MNRIIVSLPVFLIGVFLFPASGKAQIRLIPQACLYASVSDLGTVDTQEGVRDVGEQETSFAYGLTLDMSSDRAIGYRVTAPYGSDSEVPLVIMAPIPLTLIGILPAHAMGGHSSPPHP